MASTEQLAKWDRTNVDDPTKTKTIQEEYARKLRGRFSDINTEIRAGVRDRDVFGLSEEQLADYDADRLRDFSFDRDAQKQREFMQWLNKQLENGVLTTVSERENRYVHRAYIRALKNADQNMRRSGMNIPDKNPAQLVKQPIHQDKLELLYARNFQALEGITDEVSREISRVLTESLAEGVNPREGARRLTGRVDSIGKTRATVMARTEIMNTHSTASIERYRQQGVGAVGIEPEVSIQTATDQRVCQECAEAAQQGPWELDEFEGSEYQPPLHPQCRCSVIPAVNN